MGFWVALAVALVVQVIAYLLMPKPKNTTNRQSQDLREPTAEAGMPIPVVFGEIRIQAPNVLYYGDISKREYEVDA